ncbi:Maf family protein [Pantanalinema sp. GBBB05]|uniref:Maf family protein n=1 Tax=Pantanalinema sp. GBBB05 TaxID=2604139 RepID=UPI001D87BBD5|nr:septum formation inhibitor Maf [Pantanalinema sp. GBBB05]
MSLPQFVLASASPARRKLLQMVGIEPIVLPSDFDEDQIQSADPSVLVKTLALRKAEVIANQLNQTATSVPRLVMGCDSVLAIKGEIHGKPANPAEAIARWQQMRGQVGELFTGHTLFELPSDRRSEIRHQMRCQVTRVYFANISDLQIEAYVATGEPLNCAGCFALEGKGGAFVERLEGCHSNVIGLSMPLLRLMLTEFNYDITDFWQ